MILFDIMGAVFSGWMALCLFAMHIISSPERGNWMTLPGYVRHGFLLSGATFLWRSVDLFNLGISNEYTPPGHLNIQGVVALSAITYTVSALAIWQFKRIMADPRGWQRMFWVEKELKEHPDQVPVMMEKEDVNTALKAKGGNVNAISNPGPPPEETVVEAKIALPLDELPDSLLKGKDNG